MTTHFARLLSPITMTATSTQKDITTVATTVATLSLKTKLRRPKRDPGSPLLPLARSQQLHDPHGMSSRG